LNELVDGMAQIPGLVGVLLFGSVARGEADEYSDYDLLILFKDRASLWNGWDAVFAATGSTNLNIHAIPETLDELRRGNPAFLRELEKHGKVLYSREPFATGFRSPLARPFSIVSYDLSPLSYREKMRILYRLYEGGGGGLVARSGRTKLARGCVLVPRDAGQEILSLARSSGAKASKIDVLVEGRRLRGSGTRSGAVLDSGSGRFGIARPTRTTKSSLIDPLPSHERPMAMILSPQICDALALTSHAAIHEENESAYAFGRRPETHHVYPWFG
jgi:predicted nucleotidyltransferase